MRLLKAVFLCLAFCLTAAQTQYISGGSPDPFVVNDSWLSQLQAPAAQVYFPNKNTNAETLRTQSYNPAVRNLALIVAGQSNCMNANPTLFTPSASVDQLNIYDGGIYSVTAAPLGTPFLGATTLGNVGARLAQLFITNNIFDRVILASICMPSTLSQEWATGSLKDRIGQAIKRFKAKGFIPGATNLAFAISWWQGESDGPNSVSAATYTANIQTIVANAQAAGFNCFTCYFFVNLETIEANTTSSTIRTGQTNAVNGTTIRAGGDIDTLTGGTNRQADGTHLGDTGAANAAPLVFNAMHAAGAPF